MITLANRKLNYANIDFLSEIFGLTRLYNQNLARLHFATNNFLMELKNPNAKYEVGFSKSGCLELQCR